MAKQLKKEHSQYLEVFPEDFSMKHKVSENTEKKFFHLHSQYEIVYALSNNMICKTEHGSIPIPQGSCILFNQMDMHHIECRPNTGVCDRFVLYFSAPFISVFFALPVNLLTCFAHKPNQMPPIAHIPLDTRAEFERMLEQTTSLFAERKQLLSLSHQDKTNEYALQTHALRLELRMKFLLGEVLLIISQCRDEQFSMSDNVAYLRNYQLANEIHDHITMHCSENLQTGALAEKFYISKSKLYALFREMFHSTVYDYVLNCRIAKAKSLLLNSMFSVEIISQMVGYTSMSSFSRRFKTTTGLSPIQYRQRRIMFDS